MMGLHEKRSPAGMVYLAVFLLVIGACILWVAAKEGDAAMKWISWLLGNR